MIFTINNWILQCIDIKPFLSRQHIECEQQAVLGEVLNVDTSVIGELPKYSHVEHSDGDTIALPGPLNLQVLDVQQ